MTVYEKNHKMRKSTYSHLIPIAVFKQSKASNVAEVLMKKQVVPEFWSSTDIFCALN